MATGLTTVTSKIITLITCLFSAIGMWQRKATLKIFFVLMGVIWMTSATNHSISAVTQASSHLTDVIHGDFNKLYTDVISKDRTILYQFVEKHTEGEGKSEAVRLAVSSPTANLTYPVIFVVRRERNVLSWQVPLVLRYKYSYNVVSRTICPTRNEIRKNEPVSVEVTSMSPTPVEFTLEALILDEHEFEVGVGNATDMSVTPATPMYFKFSFPAGVDSVKLHATSDDHLCTVISVQQTQCPVYDLVSNVQSTGIYQTWTTKASMTISRDKFQYGEFLIILSVQASNTICSDLEVSGERKKNMTLRIETTISHAQWIKGIAIPVAFFLSFYLLFILIAIICHQWEKRKDDDIQAPADDARADGRQIQLYTDDGADNVTDDDIFSDALDIDFSERKNFIKRKIILYISNMAMKNYKRVDKENNLYFWNLVTITIFYGLPVVQLVITFHELMDLTGDEDVCYFNFECSHALGVFGAFNNVFSNIGYIMLGILFVLVAYRRNCIYKRRTAKLGAAANQFGIPQHFGLFYAMGWALVMEGIMSGSYHVCPNYSNFQFDTAFMYVISFLTLLKLYQNRHPDINAKANAAYLIIACLILMAVFGVVYGTTVFWWIFAVIYLTLLFFISLYLYYMVPLRLKWAVFKTLFSEIKANCFTSLPSYHGRFVLLFVINLINWAIVIYGAISQPADFASLFLGLFIINLIIYIGAYLCMKFKSGEKYMKCLSTLPILLIPLSGLLWIFALFFFLNQLTSWQDLPAESREINAPCMLLDFYDRHDVWHFLSATALFFSFMVVLTMDDNLRDTRRDTIRVF